MPAATTERQRTAAVHSLRANRLSPPRFYFIKWPVSVFSKIFFGVIFLPLAAFAQIDPVKRDLIQFGANVPMEGQSPVAGYAYYYHNQPDFLRTNLTWRLALAPVYVDTELGFVHGLGANTDFAIGLAGGGFADSYNEISGGRFAKEQSFDGDGGEISASIYHRFNPDHQIPLNFVLHGAAHYAAYGENDTTAKNFQTPNSGTDFTLRTGLRYGGIEPTLFPDLAMELAAWYQGGFRTDAGRYGFNGDRNVENNTHLFWGSAALSYTFPESKQNIFARLIVGTSINADRLSAYRLGGFLPLIAEYPLSLPGYFYQEFSARQFALINASYLIPVTRCWSLQVNGATGVFDYLPGSDQPGAWVSGVGAGIMYRSPTDRFKIIVSYAYGIDAVRTHGRGASNIGLLLQVDLDKIGTGFSSTHPDNWRGWSHLFNR